MKGLLAAFLLTMMMSAAAPALAAHLPATFSRPFTPKTSRPRFTPGLLRGVGRQARGMFLYGVGADIPAFSHVYFRTEFRGLGYKAPDFGLNALRTNAFSFSYEPSVGVVYRF